MTSQATRIKLGKSAIQKLASPTKPGARSTVYDTETPKLAIRITHSGRKSFYVIKRMGTQQAWIRLGNFPDVTVEQARVEAAKVLGEYAKGSNPAKAKRALKGELTFKEAFTILKEEKKKRDGRPLAGKTKQDYQTVFDKHLKPIQCKRLSDIDSEQVQAIHDAVTKMAPAQANKALAVVSSVFGYMKKRKKFFGPNAAADIQKNYEETRKRYLNGKELVDFFAALDASSGTTMRDIFYSALLTGARISNVCSMRWENVDMESGLWWLGTTKNGESQNVTLSPETLSILRSREADRDGSPFVFPGVGKTGHIVEPKGAWKVLLAQAKIHNLRIHDLRRTLGSWEVKTGASLVVIGKSLNHLSLQSTKIYAQVDVDSVREAVNDAAAAMLNAGKSFHSLAGVAASQSSVS